MSVQLMVSRRPSPQGGSVRLALLVAFAVVVAAAGITLAVALSGPRARSSRTDSDEPPSTSVPPSSPPRPAPRQLAPEPPRRPPPTATAPAVASPAPPAAAEAGALGAGRVSPVRPLLPGPLSAADRAERLGQAAHFRTHLKAIRERVADLEKDLERLRREGGTREQINEIEQQIQAAHNAEPRMKAHLERIEDKLKGR